MRAIIPCGVILAGLPGGTAGAGPYPPAAGQPGSTAVPLDDPSIVRWAETVHRYEPGEDVEADWQVPAEALGPAEGTAFDVVSLGRGGIITLTFDPPIVNGPGADFAVFENAFSPSFLELAFVEVSSNGETYVRFPAFSETESIVGPFGSVDPTNVAGLAGKYMAGFGTPFDLSDLPDSPGVDAAAITHIRLVDVIGGLSRDSEDGLIYDPFPTFGSAGFDLDAVAVLQQVPASIRILGLERVEGGVEIEWESTVGTQYRIEVALNPKSGWTTLKSITAVDGTHRERVSLVGTQGFIRVVAIAGS